MRTWLYHLLVAAAVALTVVLGTVWMVGTGLPELARVDFLVESPVVQVVLLTLGILV